MAVWLVLRLVLWLGLNPMQFTATETVKLFAYGFWFDINTLSFLLLPCVFLSVPFSDEEAEKQTQPHAFISNYQELGYYKNDMLVVLSPKQKSEAYKVDPVTLESTPTKMDDALLNEAIAYYQTASRAYKQGKLKEDQNLN